MDFNIGNLVSGVIGAVAQAANAVVNALSPVAEGGGIFGGIAAAVIGAATLVANVCEDGGIDEDEIDELLAEIYKVFVGAFMAMFGNEGSNSENYGDGDNIVISGDYTSQGGHYIKRSFIEPAIKRINDLKNQGKKDITWIVANSGYDSEDKKKLIDYASANDIKIMFIDDKEQLADYINKGKDENGTTIENRDENKISTVTVFSHGSYLEYGSQFKLALGYKDEEKPDLNISTEDLYDMNIDKNSFSSESTTWFESCNTGTITEKSVDGESFAQKWADETGSKTIALADGRTDYKDINTHENKIDHTIWKVEDSVRRNILGEEYTLDGCENYPVKSVEDGSENAKWKVYEEDSQPEDIDQSKIKEELGE
ncbi:hypothetical protein [Clostridium saccharobutylicum]|uniref:Uncharacterized protein n=1 Tax=Clostridium saccharobutylicum TaxID=169679 RepID=A0A1S8N5Y1_CLOSA|nr:hypothetical protein [Clostridium saccharobutylicum]OOM11681.1 hypothetical protein CLOSAC_21080 [Clostridium saccharobutylicum]